MESELCVDVFIEIAKGSNIKYEYDKKREALVCDRILHTPFNYEFNYGFIPDTLSPDGDALDVVPDWKADMEYILCLGAHSLS